MAPCGGCYNPHVFCLEWTSTDLPPSATFVMGHGIASPPGAALGGPQACGLPLVWADQWAPQGQQQPFLPYNSQGRAVAPAPPGLPLSHPCYHHLKGQYIQHRLSSTAKPLGAPLGSGSPSSNDVPMDDDTPPGGDIPLGRDVPMDEGTLLGGDIPLGSDFPMDDDTPPGGDIPLGSDVPMDEGPPPGHDNSLGSDIPMDEGTLPGQDNSLGSDVPMDDDTLPGGDNPLGSDVSPSHSAALDVQAIRDPVVIPAGDFVLPEEVLLEEAMRHLTCSLGAVGISQDNPSSVPIPRDFGGTSGTMPHHKISSPWLPEKMLSADYSVPKTSKAILSMEHFNTIRMKPEDPRQDAGTDLPPPQGSVSRHDIRLEKRGKKRRYGSLPKTGSKRKAPAARAGAGGWDEACCRAQMILGSGGQDALTLL